MANVGGGQKPKRTPSKAQLNPRQQAAADSLKRTIKGGGGGSGQVRPDGVITGGTPIANGGHSVAQAANRPPAQNRPLQDNLDSLAQAINGGKPLTADDYASWTPQQRFDYAEGAAALRVNSALGNVPLAMNSAVAAVQSNVPQGIQNALAVITQTSVGGQKGSKEVIDRSEANKRGWATRKKLYGSSGRKG